MVATEQEVTVRRPNPLRMLIKGLLFIIVKPIVLIIMGFRRFPLPALILMMILLGSFFYVTGGASAPLPWQGGQAAAGKTNPRVAIETYLTGQKEFDSALMWTALSDEVKEEMQKKGQTQESYVLRNQPKLDMMRQSGVQHIGHRYIAGGDLDNGRSVHVYAVTFAQGGQAAPQVPMTFTLDKSGKILNVE